MVSRDGSQTCGVHSKWWQTLRAFCFALAGRQFAQLPLTFPRCGSNTRSPAVLAAPAVLQLFVCGHEEHHLDVSCRTLRRREGLRGGVEPAPSGPLAPAVRGDMDTPEGALVVEHGYCAQELVNLLLTGRATSNVFDGSRRQPAFVPGFCCCSCGIVLCRVVYFASHV